MPHKLNWLQKLDIKTVVDVGANIGQFAKEARELFAEAQIYSFEPLASCYQTLTEKFMNDKNFKAFNFALGEREGEIEIHKSDYSPGSSILRMKKEAQELFPHITEQADEKIKIKRLDDLAIGEGLSKEILIKIDTEGYEKNVIEGGMSTIKKAKVIVIENSYIARFEGQALFPEIYKLLTDAGFEYRGAWTEKLNPQTGEILFEDSIFLKR